MESAQCVSQLSVWELISDSMDRNRFGMSIIWTWSNLDSLDCCLQTFHVKNVAYMQFHSSNVNCFLFRGWCEVSFIWNKQKQQSKCYTWIESVQKMFWDRTEVMLNWRGRGPGPGSVLALEHVDTHNAQMFVYGVHSCRWSTVHAAIMTS